ncbi:MAG: class I tRNA ligase family protein, partial [Thermoflexus sp.]
GWPDETEDLRYFYPTTVMETGYDILFFWVARMVMMGLAMTGEIPFRIVYLHGLVRDEKGEKMSKTKGNVIDPLVVIREYGADALRFTLATGSTPGNDMRLSLQRVEGNRNFANKLWNAARFVLSTLPGSIQRPSMEDPSLTMPDRWILSRYHRTVATVTEAMEAFDFGEAGRRIYEFAWDEFCDWYIEIAKEPLYRGSEADQARTRGVLVYVLDGILRMLHPFMPFITEALWGYLKQAGAVDGAEGLIVASWPSPGPVDESAEAGMQVLIETIRAIRNAREAHRVPSERRIAAWIAAGELLPVRAAHRDLLATLARVDPNQLMLVADLHEPPEDAVTYSAGPIRIYLPLAGLIDRAAERARLERELADLEARIAKTEALLASEFAARAPAGVVEKERRKLEELRARRARLQAEWERLKE